MFKFLLVLFGIGSAIPAAFFFLIAWQQGTWNCGLNGLQILAANFLAALGVSIAMVFWRNLSPVSKRFRPELLLLPWLTLAAPTLFVLFVAPSCDLVSIRNQPVGSER